mmetsp:Transcript_2118/g.5553  ORF Transcript_2118/g.5553 Transcript_2118/m.5553 type:complete len:222 (-) Transcript_2118:81-746(-)
MALSVSGLTLRIILDDLDFENTRPAGLMTAGLSAGGTAGVLPLRGGSDRAVVRESVTLSAPGGSASEKVTTCWGSPLSLVESDCAEESAMLVMVGFRAFPLNAFLRRPTLEGAGVALSASQGCLRSASAEGRRLARFSVHICTKFFSAGLKFLGMRRPSVAMRTLVSVLDSALKGGRPVTNSKASTPTAQMSEPKPYTIDPSCLLSLGADLRGHLVTSGDM